jgi:hypothetical protein
MLIMFCLLLLSFLILLYKVYKSYTITITITKNDVQSDDDIADELVIVYSNPWELI